MPPSEVSEREAEVLAAVGRHLTNTQIASRLHISVRTVESHVSSLLRKYGVANRRELAILAAERQEDAVAGFADRILAACPGTRILATSRERLGVPGERIVRVGPLPLASHAEALFTDRARAADPDFAAGPAAVAEICARLDGMPLAIELAAARSAALGADGVLAALDDRLRLLAGGRGADARHRSLRAVLTWSHDLLDAEERALFRRLAVFAGAFDLAAVLAVAPGTGAGAAADVLGRLVDKSLAGRAGPARWRLLETVRAFAAEQLALSGEEADARSLHLAWSSGVAAELAARDGDVRAEFDTAADDLRAALTAAPADAGEVAHGLARSLGRLAYRRRFPREAHGHFLDAAERAGSPGEASADLKSAADCTHVMPTGGHRHYELLCTAADRARDAGDGNAEAVLLAAAVVTTARNPGWYAVPQAELRRLAERAEAASDRDDPVVAAWLAAARAWTAPAEPYSADPALAERAVALARAAGDPVLVSAALDALVSAALRAGRLREAHRVARDRLDLLAGLPLADPRCSAEVVDIVHVAVNCAFAAGDLPAALAAARPALADDLLGDQYYLSTNNLILPLALSGAFGEALRHADGAWESWLRAGRPESGMMQPVAVGPALVHGLRGDRERHAMWRARTSGEATGQVFGHATLAGFADALVAVHTGRLDTAAGLVGALFSDATNPLYAGYAHPVGAELAVLAGLPDAAARIDAAEPAAAENAWGAACLARARGRLHGDPAELAAAVEGWERIGARFERASTLLLLPGREDEGRAELAELLERR